MKLSYGDVLKELNYAFYVEGKKLSYLSIKQSTDDKIKNNPLFTKIIIIDTNAAHLQAKLNHIDTEKSSALSAEINTGLTEMGRNKQTVAFQSAIASEVAPLLEKAQEEQTQKEELQEQLQKRIKKLHKDIPEIIKELKSGPQT